MKYLLKLAFISLALSANAAQAGLDNSMNLKGENHSLAHHLYMALEYVANDMNASGQLSISANDGSIGLTCSKSMPVYSCSFPDSEAFFRDHSLADKLYEGLDEVIASGSYHPGLLTKKQISATTNHIVLETPLHDGLFCSKSTLFEEPTYDCYGNLRETLSNEEANAILKDILMVGTPHDPSLKALLKANMNALESLGLTMQKVKMTKGTGNYLFIELQYPDPEMGRQISAEVHYSNFIPQVLSLIDLKVERIISIIIGNPSLTASTLDNNSIDVQ